MLRQLADDTRRRAARRILRVRNPDSRPLASYAGLRALVTGSAGGIGAAIAAQLAEAGSSVTGIDLLDPSDPPPGVEHIRGDVRHFDFAALKPFDLIVANAGVADSSGDGELPDEAIDRLVSTNLTGLVRTLEAPKTDGATLVIVSSDSAVSGLHQGAVYAATKAAALNLGYTLGARHPTTVALVGLTQTRLFEHRDRFRGVRPRPMPPGSADPADVARVILDGARRGERIVVTHPGTLAHVRRYCSWLLAADRSGPVLTTIGGVASIL